MSPKEPDYMLWKRGMEAAIVGCTFNAGLVVMNLYEHRWGYAFVNLAALLMCALAATIGLRRK